MQCIDTHVHLQNKAYADDLEAVLTRAADAGVRACIVPGSDLASSRAAVALAERYAAGACALYAAVGVHPTNGHTLTPEVLAELETLAQHPRVVAVGEIGLDYYWPRRTDRSWRCATRDEQQTALEQQLQLAAEHDLPVILHDRDAHDAMLETLEHWRAGGVGRTGTLHAYAGGPQRLDAVLALGFYVGMDGPVTYSDAGDLRDVARAVPLDRLLLETDGPYLTPAPHRGKRNESSYLTYIAQRIAELRQTEMDRIAEAATRNARALFDLPHPGAEPEREDVV
jgi:TatD DNase family protein